MRSLLLVVLAVVAPTISLGAEYPCPSDPGFCYRDLGNDGCFDVGTDVGPINDEIESSSVPVPPTPGSIVCPPSVSTLSPSEIERHIYLATLPGSDILFYRAKVVGVRAFHLDSGRDLLLGGLVNGESFSASDTVLEAVDDITIEKGILLTNKANLEVDVTSSSGSVTIGPKAKFKSATLIVSAFGDVTLGEGVAVKVIFNADIEFMAGGDLELTRPKLTSNGSTATIALIGSNVTIHDKAKLVTKPVALGRLEIDATSGDVEIDRLIASVATDVEISGQNVAIGLPDTNGVVRQSRLAHKSPFSMTDITATGVVSLSRLQLLGSADATIDTTGATLGFTDSTIKGVKGGAPTVTISTGAASTCDLTGTTLKNATLVTNCDNVVGP